VLPKILGFPVIFLQWLRLVTSNLVHRLGLCGKPGNFRDFDISQGNVRDFTESQGKVAKNCLLLVAYLRP